MKIFDAITLVDQEKILLWVFRILAIASPLLVWAVSSDMLLTMAVTRNLLFRMLVDVLVFLYVLIFITNNRYRPHISFPFLALLGVWLLYLCSSLINGTFLWSFWGDYVRMDGLLQFGHLIAYWFVLAQVFKEEKDWHWYWQMVIFVGLGSGLIALSQSLGRPLFLESAGGVRATSLFGNAAYYAFFQLTAIFFTFIVSRQRRHTGYSFLLTLLLLTIGGLGVFELYVRFYYHLSGPLSVLMGNVYMLCLTALIILYAILYYRQRREYQRRLLFAMIILVQVLGLIASSSKAAVLAFFAGILTIAFLEIWRHFKIFYARVIIVIVACLTSISILMVFPVFLGESLNVKPWESVTRLVQSVSSSQRQQVWSAAEKAFSKKAILGWGLNNFDRAFEQNYPDSIYDSFNSPLWYDKAHNAFWQHAVEGGIAVIIAGLLFFYFIYRRLLRWLRRTRQEYMVPIWLGFTVAYFLISMAYFDTLNNAMFFMAGTAWIESQWREVREKRPYGLPVSLGIRSLTLLFLLSALIILFVYNFHWRSWQSNRAATALIRQSRDALDTIDTGRLDALDKIIYTAPSLGKSDIRSQYATLLSDYLIYASANRELLPKYLERAQDHLEKNISKRNMLVRSSVELLNYDLLAGRIDSQYWDKGQAIANNLSELYPRRVHLLYLLGRFYILRGHAEDGLVYFQRAVDLRPDIFDTYFNYYKQIATLRSDEVVDQYFDDKMKKFGSLDSLEVAKFDLALERPDRAIKRLQAATNSSVQTKSSEYWRLYSLAYYQLGNIDASLQAARAALVINPDLLLFFTDYLGASISL